MVETIKADEKGGYERDKERRMNRRFCSFVHPLKSQRGIEFYEKVQIPILFFYSVFYRLMLTTN
jgi:nucleosome binding factor SPN SPT16 subunit